MQRGKVPDVEGYDRATFRRTPLQLRLVRLSDAIRFGCTDRIETSFAKRACNGTVDVFIREEANGSHSKSVRQSAVGKFRLDRFLDVVRQVRFDLYDVIICVS